MTDENWSLFDMETSPARTTDPATSQMAGKPFKRGSQRYRILEVYGKHPAGLIDEEATTLAGLIPQQSPWKRCSELRELGMIDVTGDTRESTMGKQQQVCRINFNGRRQLGLSA